MDLIKLVGALFIGYYALQLILFVIFKFLAKGHNLKARYGGQRTFAVVTGGSDGIGLAICNELAAQGFNICIVSRNATKINEKCNELKKRYP
jgi:short-subunit dehydrogenase